MKLIPRAHFSQWKRWKEGPFLKRLSLYSTWEMQWRDLLKCMSFRGLGWAEPDKVLKWFSHSQDIVVLLVEIPLMRWKSRSLLFPHQWPGKCQFLSSGAKMISLDLALSIMVICKKSIILLGSFFNYQGICTTSSTINLESQNWKVLSSDTCHTPQLTLFEKIEVKALISICWLVI